MIGVCLGLIIFGLCVLVGLSLKRNAQKEYNNILEYDRFLLFCKTKMLSEKWRVDEVFSKYLADNISSYIKNIMEQKSLDKEVVEFWKTLGNTTYIMLEECFDNHIKIIKSRLEKAKKNYERNGQNYGRLGVIIGLLLFVLLI